LKFQAPVAVWLSSTQDYAAAVIYPPSPAGLIRAASILNTLGRSPQGEEQQVKCGMKHFAIATIITLALVVACAPTSTPQLPAALATATQAATVTLFPTETPAVSPSPAFTNTPAPTNTATPTATPRPPTLRELADGKGVTLGVFVDPRYNSPENEGRIIAQNFNLLFPGSFSWDWIRRRGPDTNIIDFDSADRWVNFAVKNNMRVRGGSLVTNSGLPEWLTSGQFTREQLTTILQNHIKAVVGRYKDRISEWIVANEVFIYYNGRKGIQDSIFYRAIGPEFIDIAFKAARDADPNAKLIYNDFDIEVGGPKADYIFEQVKRLKEKGLVDAVGFQMHVTKPPNLDAANPPKKSDLIAQMRRYKDIGVEVIVTELDVDSSRLPGTEQQKLASQAEIYKMVVEACLELGACNNIEVWGFNDSESYLVHQGINTSPLLFSNDKPKPAYYAIRDVLARRP
jgi:endo-1,4-beta-xylanase